MKRFSKVILFALSFTIIFTVFNVSKADAFTYKPGDILVTKSTSAKGIAGHSAIVINSTTVLHTSGWKSEPYPLPMSITKWTNRYSTVKVVRPDSAKKGQAAADAAVKYFKGKTIPYRITSNPRDIDPYTYCSELVWYAYYKAGYPIKYPLSDQNGIYAWYTPSNGMVYPYDFVNKTIMDNSINSFTIVDNKW
ncbi:hypothetical protein ACFWDG_07025 [Peribacillus sp. NPDC060186]